MELPRLAVADDRVAGVVAALEADDDVGLLGEQVDDLALALVAPLGADDHGAWHACRSVGARLRRPSDARASRRVLAAERAAATHISFEPRDGALADLLGELVLGARFVVMTIARSSS